MNERAETESMSTTTERPAAISLTPAAQLRLCLPPDSPAYTLLDGGWWPRSADPAAELPGLILALDERHGPAGPITRIMLNMADWDLSRPRRLRVDGPAGSRVVRLGWFATMPVGLLTATSTGGQRTDLLTRPARHQRAGRPDGHGTGRSGRQPQSHSRPPGRHHQPGQRRLGKNRRMKEIIGLKCGLRLMLWGRFAPATP